MSDTLKRIRASRISKMTNPDNSLPEKSFLAMLIGECEMIGKNAGREVTEDEVQKHLRKVLKGVVETMEHTPANELWDLHLERQFIEALLPQMASDDDLRAVIVPMCNSACPMGEIMGAVKKAFGAQADMKRAAQIVKECSA